ncbi:MAG: ABC transporter ATP-binding protein [Caldanaerobacter sp.]|uniref:ABC transporter ATP-binding protein n=1 Tax=Caldanaerobacter sp. TaxID=2930036 RepID=UPI003C775EFE
MREFLFKYKKEFVLAVFFLVASVLINIYFAFIYKKLIDVATTRDLVKFYSVVKFAVMFTILEAVVGWLNRTTRFHYMKKTLIYLKDRLFRAIIKRDVEHFNEVNTGKYISIISNDVKIVEEDYFNNFFRLLGSAVGFVAALISLFILSYKITVMIILMAILSVIIPRIFDDKIAKMRNDYSESLELFTIESKDTLTGLEVIKSFGIEDKVHEKFSKVNEDVEDKKLKYSILLNTSDTMSEILSSFIFLSVFAVGLYFTIKGEMTLGTMIACVQLSNSIIMPIYSMGQNLNRILSLKSISQKINEVLQEKEERNDYIPVKSFNDSIEFKNVSFSYTGETKALKNINFTIKKGGKYALVGTSGAGKSTILKLLLKQYENYEGEIKLDGIELRRIDKKDLFKIITLLHQNVFIFDGTIKDNITLFNDRYTDEEVVKAAKIAGLGPLLEKLPEGIYSDVGEGGKLLSGGERQRIAIARSVITNASILALDEATAALDNETAYLIEKTILDMDITAIVVTHRLWSELLKRYDEIIVLRDGRIVEKGRFDDLMKMKGYFYSLFNIEKLDKGKERIEEEGIYVV